MKLLIFAVLVLNFPEAQTLPKVLITFVFYLAPGVCEKILIKHFNILVVVVSKGYLYLLSLLIEGIRDKLKMLLSDDVS